MTPLELLADNLARNAAVLKMTLADFADAELFVRPVPAANHAAWQLAHLTGTTAQLIDMVDPGVTPPAAVGWATTYAGATANDDDPTHYPTKTQLLETFSQTTDAVAQWVRTLTVADLDKPTTDRMAGFAPTVGLLILMTASHMMMHAGQFQVIRRKLGKPLLF